MNVIIINSIAYWCTAFYYYKKNGLSLHSFLWFYYSLFSFFSVLLMKDDLYFNMSGVDPHTRISIIPYIILYFSFQLLTKPIRRFSINNVKCDINLYNSKKLWNFFKIANMLALLYVFIKLLQVYFVAEIGFGVMHDMEDSSDIIYPGVLGLFLRPLNLICRINGIVIMPMVVYFSLNGYVKSLLKTKTVLWMVLPYCIGTVLMGFVGGSRAAMFFGIMQVLFFYIIFHKYIPHKINKYILFFSSVFSVFAIIVTINITKERFGEVASFAVENSILDYLGQMFPNVNYRIWEQNSVHTMGRRLFPLFWGGEHMSSEDFHHKYNVVPWIFHSTWGGLYEEFGLVISVALVFVLYYMMEFFMKRKYYSLSDITMCLFVYYICFTSLFDYHIGFVEYVSIFIILESRNIFKKIKWYTN